jgi:hypothetical protein
MLHLVRVLPLSRATPATASAGRATCQGLQLAATTSHRIISQCIEENLTFRVFSSKTLKKKKKKRISSASALKHPN